jgi:hypothetical protein
LSSDDCAYTLYPARMLQTGGFGVDPFSDRGTLSLGGESFLQALVLAALPLEYIYLADPGLAYLAVGVMLLTTRGLSGPARLALGAFFATLPTESPNASANAVPVVLLLAIARDLGRVRGRGTARAAAGVGLLLAALLCLKSTLVPGGVLLVFFWGVVQAAMARRARPIVLGALTALFALAMMLPWMVSSYRSAGTLFYPYLGAGFRAHTLAAYPHKSMRTPKQMAVDLAHYASQPPMVVILVGVAMAAAIAFAPWRPSARRVALLTGCAASLTSVLLFVAVFGGHRGLDAPISRYAYPFNALTGLLAYAAVLRTGPGEGRSRPVRAAAYAVLGLNVAFYAPETVHSRGLRNAVAGALAGRTRFSFEDVERYRRIQASVPPSARFLCLLDWPLLFDLRRNDLHYADNVGYISPPPGLPLRGTPEELVSYLRSAGVRYVVYPTPGRPDHKISDAEQAIDESVKSDPWIGTAMVLQLEMHRRLLALSTRYERLYDAGGDMVLDLGVPVRLTENDPARAVGPRPARPLLHAGRGHPLDSRGHAAVRTVPPR